MRPNITATYGDELSGVNTTTVALTLDGVNVTANATVTATGLSFTPATNLAAGQHTVNLSVSDQAGNTASRTATFTINQTPPVIDPLPLDGQTLRALRPTLTASYHSETFPINTASVALLLDGVNITANATVTATGLSFTPTANLAAGQHTISVSLSDQAGNTASRTATFTIDLSGAVINSFTIGGEPAVNGLFVSSSLQPAFAVAYTDSSGVNESATQLLLGYSNQTRQPVAATVTQTGITYTPPTPLAEGPYSVEAIIVNNLGTTASTGVINFTLDVDAPVIYAVAPTTGNQHGGTALAISGLRLLNLNGSAPTVSVGGQPAQITGATAGPTDQVTIVTPAGSPGAATVTVTTDRGVGSLAGAFNYQADARSPFAQEADTLLLWHLDETANGITRTENDGPYSTYYGTSATASQALDGRFNKGRSRAAVATAGDISGLGFGSNGFTLEGWFKTAPVGRVYTLMGRDYYPFGGHQHRLRPALVAHRRLARHSLRHQRARVARGDAPDGGGH